MPHPDNSRDEAIKRLDERAAALEQRTTPVVRDYGSKAAGYGYRIFDYLARANAKPESISLGLPTNGGIAHVAHEILTQATGAKVNYIPYPGGAPAALDVLAGHTDATLITLAAVTEYVRAGKLKALAVTTSYRSPSLPQVPTMAEAGIAHRTASNARW